MDKDQLKEIIDRHAKWLAAADGGHWANLSGCDLRGCKLSGCNLRGCNLSGCNLSWCDLSGCDLSGCDMRGCDLRGCDLRGCDLRRAALTGCDLHGCDLSGAILDNSTIGLSRHAYQVCPEEGDFVGFKKVYGGYILKLQMLADAKRSSSTGRKCRCSAALVLEATNPDGSPCEQTEFRSMRDSNFIYRVGEMVRVDDFDERWWEECSTGIHFFITRQEAAEYI